jgi:hypothetical protein
MSDKELEAPDADSAEQELDAVPEAIEADERDTEGEETPLEANQADTAEQGRVLGTDDDEYR